MHVFVSGPLNNKFKLHRSTYILRLCFVLLSVLASFEFGNKTMRTVPEYAPCDNVQREEIASGHSPEGM